MSRPKGLDRESRADLFYLWAIVLAFAICGLVALNIAFASMARAETVNRALKVDAGYRLAAVTTVMITPAAAKTVRVCAAVVLPRPGKCSHLVVRGYKVRVCR